jgi:hypothetical protein
MLIMVLHTIISDDTLCHHPRQEEAVTRIISAKTDRKKTYINYLKQPVPLRFD